MKSKRFWRLTGRRRSVLSWERNDRFDWEESDQFQMRHCISEKIKRMNFDRVAIELAIQHINQPAYQPTQGQSNRQCPAENQFLLAPVGSGHARQRVKSPRLRVYGFHSKYSPEHDTHFIGSIVSNKAGNSSEALTKRKPHLRCNSLLILPLIGSPVHFQRRVASIYFESQAEELREQQFR